MPLTETPGTEEAAELGLEKALGEARRLFQSGTAA